MDYKKIIRSRAARKKILDMLSFVPDDFMLRIQYRIKLGRKLDLKKPKRYTEKLQWLKLNYHDPLMPTCVDKYDVRSFVKNKGLANILVDCFGVYTDVDEIDWSMLPDQFVLKKTNGGGGLSVLICKDKETLDMEKTRDTLKQWVVPGKRKSMGREWAYYDLQSRIIIDQYLEDPERPEAGIKDYKFLCFGGKVKYVVLDVDRYIDHKRNVYDAEWNYLGIITDHEPYGDTIEKPDQFDELKRVAEILSEDFPAVRVDLYLVKNQIYFGELTFYPWSGYIQFLPDEFDIELGRLFVLPEERK